MRAELDYNPQPPSLERRRIIPRSDYQIPSSRRLDQAVATIGRTASQGFVRPDEMDAMKEGIDAKAALKNLPPGMTEEEYIGVTKLSLLTECATDTYARQFVESARRYNQPWLEHFTEKIWAPDERMHREPFKIILLQLGFSEEELDREIREAQERRYDHPAGNTPAHLTMFGTEQEYDTTNWYVLQERILKPSSPIAAYGIGRVKGREGLHTAWYGDFTALQIEENPALVAHAAEAVALFEMPGGQIAPELEPHVPEWLEQMGGSAEKMRKDMVRIIYNTMGTPEKAGKFVMEFAATKGMKVPHTPIPLELVHKAMTKYGKQTPLYGILGEALLESVGIDRHFKSEKPEDRIRGWMRTGAAGLIKANFDSVS